MGNQQVEVTSEVVVVRRDMISLFLMNLLTDLLSRIFQWWPGNQKHKSWTFQAPV